MSFPDCRDILLPMMLRELSGALACVGEGQDEKRNSVELLNNILEVLSRDDVVRNSIMNYCPVHVMFDQETTK